MNTELHRVMKQSRNKYHLQIRKCKKIEKFVKNLRIVENCFENDADLFNELRKQRSNKNESEVTIDGAVGDNIPNEFANVYNELYNKNDDEENVMNVQKKVNWMLSSSNNDKELEKINPFLIK